MRQSLLVAVAGALALAACSSDGAGTETASDAPATESAPTSDGALTLASGASIDSAEFAGNDVLFWFWAPW